MEVGTPLTLALQPGAGEGDGLGLGLGLGDGAGDGPVTVLDGVSSLLDPAQAGARSANVTSTTGAQNSRFMLGRIASHPPRPDRLRVTPHGSRSFDCKSTSAKHLCAARIPARRHVHTRCVRTLSTENAQYFRSVLCDEGRTGVLCERLPRKQHAEAARGVRLQPDLHRSRPGSGGGSRSAGPMR